MVVVLLNRVGKLWNLTFARASKVSSELTG